MKKRGFGEGWWNGVGGKPEEGEEITQTAIRECQEEVGITPKALRHVATLDFYFPEEPDKQGWNQQVIVYTCQSWDNEPIETEEMAPRWFQLDQIPYDKMWADDKIWLPEVLAGKFVTASFYFDSDGRISKHTMRTKLQR